jgi:hypothetical protein
MGDSVRGAPSAVRRRVDARLVHAESCPPFGEGGDLGEVGDVVDDDRVGRDADAVVVVDGEVAERVGTRRRDDECQRRQGDGEGGDEPAHHWSAARACSMTSGENDGLSARPARS